MKWTHITRVFLICLFFLFLSSCKDDDSPTPPSSTVIFSLDSLAVWLQAGSGFASSSQVFEQTTTASRVKVEYIVQSNVDSSHSEAWVRDSSNGSPPRPVEQYYYWNVDSLISYSMDVSAQPLYIKLEVRLRTDNNDIPRYIRLRNIKVSKQ